MIPQGGSSSTGSPSCSSTSSASTSNVNPIVDHEYNNASTSQCGFGSNSNRPERWLELRQSVRQIRRRLSNLSKKVPSLFTFRTVLCEHTGRAKVRLYFVSVTRSGQETTLMFADLPNTTNEISTDQLIPSFELIDPTFTSSSCAGGGGVALPSREQQLQWERKRLVTWGISSYEVHLDSGKFIFPACGRLFTCQDSGFTTTPQFPLEIKSSARGTHLNPLVCPFNSELLAYVSSGDIWVQHMASGHEEQLTFVHKGSKSVADDPLQAGLPPYVIQEEFHRFHGFWWQPQSTDGAYRLLYEEVDENDVKILHFVSHGSEDQVIEEFRFPRAGTANAKSTLKMITFQVSDCGQLMSARRSHMRQDLESLCPWMEYLVRAGWTPDGKHVWMQGLDRRQLHLEVLLIPLSDFVDDKTEISISSCHHSLAASTIIRETSASWINVHDILYFLPSTTNDDSISFVWADERTEFRRLTLVTVVRDEDTDLFTVISRASRGPSSDICNGEKHYKFTVIKEVPLTSGVWEVTNKQISVDETRLIAYFTGMQQGPLEKHLYAVSLNSPCDIRQITTSGYSHMVTMNKECTRFVTVYSSISTMPTCEVFAMDYPENVFSVHKIIVTSLGFLMKQNGQFPAVPDMYYRSPRLFIYEPPDRSDPLHCMIFTPPDMKANVKYPTVLYVYGGPEVQLVNNSFKGMRTMRQHLLAEQGYVVVVVDSRGSCHRGVKFESYIRRRMGTVEIGDQVSALQWLSEKTGYIDMSRVAVHGWSYGGYLSLMALAQRPDIFKIAVAGAPVTSWLLYDTAYTERYMDLPSLNPQGYATGNVLVYVHSFPDEENRLMIIHGLIDENVHFQHTSQLISALVKAGKPYHLQIYPGERHSLRHLDASEHYETNLLSFLDQHL